MNLHVLKDTSTPRLVGKFAALAASLLVIVVALTGTASADLDTFSTGDGHEGAVTVSTNSVLNYSAPLSAAASAGATSITTGAGQTGAVGSATTTGSPAQTQFEASRLALVIQSSNYSGSAPSGNQTDIDLSSNSVGRWELARISSVTGSVAVGMTVNFANPLVNSYAGTGAQIVAVPEFTTVQVNNTRSWSANPWNGTSGGITAFLANGAVNLNNASSSINANGDGFRGGLLYNGTSTACTQLDGTVGGGKGEGIVSGVYPGNATTYASRGNVANGGGGGVCENSGGGGGGNGGQGGIGGQSYDGSRNVGGLGGSKLNYSAFDHAVFGGGGGAGDENNTNGGAGGSGGGFVFVRADSLTGSGSIAATGNAGADSANVGSSDGAGGGGAGGVVYARFNTTAACGGVTVKGGAGGNELSTGGVHGPGGGGAGGRLVLQSSGGTCPATVGNGVGGSAPNGSGGTRGSGPTSSTDATSSGATEAVTGGGGLSTPTAAVSSPANGAYVNTATPTISGTSSMTLGTIRVTVDGTYVTSVTTAANGTWSYTPGSALTAGSHTYTVQPVYYGIAGSATSSRTLIVDLVSPSVAISGLSSPTASGSSQTATIAASDNVAITTQTCKLDSGAATACTTSYATGALTNGSHTITVVASDAAGNTTTQTATIVVDQTVPTVAISGQSTPTASTSSQTLTITASDNVALSTVTCKVDSGSATSCIGGTYATGVLTAGSHTITVVATDTVGNATTQTATIVVDQTNPTVSITGLTTPTNSTASQTATITAADNVALSSVTCNLDSGSATSCIGGTYATGVLTAGSHTITVVATDTSGNVTTQTSTVVVDTTVPTVSISGQTSPTALSTSQSLTITASDNVALSTVTCKVDSGSATSCIGGAYATGVLTAGSHTITVLATDTAGNTTTQTATIVVDQTPPSVAITGLSTPTASGASQTATITASDNIAIATQTCKLDSGSAVACTTSFATGALTNGTHTITVVATDTAGNATTQTATIVVDQTNPTVAISGQTTPTVSTTSQNLTITSSDNVALSTVTCKVDSGATTSCIGGTYATGVLTAGSHTITVLATDSVGNTTTQTATIVVDQTNPTVAISGQVTPTNSGSSQSLTITSSDNVALSTVTCKVDSGSATSCIGGSYATGALTAGSHTITVVATDTVGNATTQTATIVIDQTVPSVAISGLTSPTKFTTTQTATITASDNIAIATQTCKLDLGAATACTTSFATGALTVGNHTITVVATDTAGNVTTQTATIVVDQTAPSVAISGLTTPTSSTASQTATITASDNVAIATQTCKLDAGAATACTTSYVTGVMAAGSHTITVVATDTAGNVTTQTATIVVDTTVPTVSITGLTTPTNSGASQTATITAADNIALSTVTCKLDSGATTSCIGGSYATGALTAGTHTLTVVATDTAGNQTTQTSTIVIDQANPTVSISGITTPTISGSSQTATITASDNTALSTVTCKVDSGATTSCIGGSYATGALTAGSHTITVVATDTSGNQTTQTATIVVDQTPPSVAISGLTTPTNSTASQTATITASDNVAIATQTCKLDSGATTACTTSYATGVLTAGSHTITVIATDTVGNSTTQTATIVVDQTLPTVAISGLSTPTNSTASQTATITASDNVAIATQTCKLDSGAATACTTSYATGVLTAGSHTITVVATDTAGNQRTQTATIVVDQTAPSVAISGLTSPTNSTASQTATITASDNIAIASQTCKVDSGATTACTTSYATGVLAAGSHTITVVATDTAGNITTQTATVVVDTSSPVVTITPPTSPTASGASQNVAFTATDNGTVTLVECKLDGGSFATCTSPFATGALAAGSHTVSVRATDNAGNQTTQSVTIVIDQTGPSVTISGLTSPSNVTTSQTATIVATDNVAVSAVACSIDGGSSTSCIGGSYATGTLTAGTHTLSVTATDTSGNATTQTATIVVDLTAPTVSISGLSTPTRFTTSQTATITASDNIAIATQTCKIDAGAATACTTSFATGVMTAGSHTITVVATDTAGNQTTQTATIVVDQTAPSVAISGLTSPTASSSSQTATITASDNIALSTVTCRVDSGSATSCIGGSYATGALTAGSHTITVVATDTAGNQTTQTATVVVDQTPPSVAISGLTSPTSSSASQTATITASDNIAIATQTCKLDSGSAVACTTSFATGALTAGSHTITVVATDTSGNATTQTATIVVDQTAPSVAISGLTSPTASGASQTATIAASDNIAIATQTCKLDAGAATACTTSFATGALSAGSHTITVVATDTSGNVTTQTATIVVDQTVPSVAISGLSTPTRFTTSQTATITASDNVGITTQTCKLDSGSATACTTSYATGILTAGSHTITVVATDASGNSTTQTATIVVDQTAPSVAISGLSTPTRFTTSQTATITASDNVAIATQTCKLDSGAATACTTSYATGVMTVGSHTITVVATDTAGNQTTQTATIVVDQTNPTVSISGLTTPTAAGSSQTATITASDNIALGTVTCKVDAGATTSCIGGSYATGALAAGSHTITVVATDTAGNQTTQTATIVVDQTNPTVSISGLTTPTSSSSSQTATITASDNVAIATQTCKLDSGAATACTTSYATGALTAGSHTITVVATDTSGNSTTQTATIIVDQTAPSLTISGTTSPTSSGASQTATIMASDNIALSTVTCKLDGGATTSCIGGSYATGALTAGSHTITVVATDTSGNQTTKTTAIVVDQTPPSVAISGLTTLTNSGASQTATITASDNVAIATQTCKLDSGTATACTTSYATGVLSAGSHTITVVATDTSGNSTTQTATIVVDQTAPSVAISGLSTPTRFTTSQTATITASDNVAIATQTCKLDSGAATACTTSYATGVLGAGSHTITVVATDTAGNTTTQTATIIVDQTAPSVAISGLTSPTNSTSSQTAAITASDNIAIATQTCKLDSGTATACTTSFATGALSAGSHTITVVATDTAGNTTTQTATILVDTTPPPAPTVTRVSPASSPTNSTTAQVTFSANESGGTLLCSIDGGSFSTCASSPLNFSSLADGPHSVAVKQVDAAGNTGSVTSVAWTVDTNPPPAPTVTRTAPTSSPTSSTSAQITFSANESGGALQCKLDGASFTTCPSSPDPLSGLADGSHTYSVRQLDDAGNPGIASTVSWTVDTVAPGAPTVNSNRTGTVSESTATITYTPSEVGGTLECSLDGAAFTTCASSPISLTGLTDGPHTYSVRELDDAGNADSASTVAWIVDLTAPNAPAITSPTGSPSYSPTTTPTISGTAEPNSTVKLYDGATLIGSITADGSGNWSITSDPLSDGSHSVTATATDSAGNTGSASPATSIVVDATTPTVAITAPATASFVNTISVNVVFTLTDANPAANSSCKIDGGSFVSCTSGFTTPALSSGSHTITVQHTDLAGNVGSSSTTFTVDNSTPIVSITSPTAGQNIPTSNVSVAFSVSDDNPSASSSCSIDGGATSACTSPFATGSLSDGSHTVTVSHTDSAGNTGTAAITFTVDTQSPNKPTITDAPANPVASDAADFSFTGAESGGSFECSLDGAAFTACTSPVHYLSLTDGAHEFQVRQIDGAANAGAPETYDWTVDTAPPAAPTVTGPSAHTSNPDVSVSFAGSPDTVELRCSFNGGAFATCPTSPLSLGTLADGNYTFTVEAFDAAGNSSTTTIGWEVDTAAPGAPTITSGPVGSVPSPDAEFAFVGAESGGIYRCSIGSQPAVNCTSPFDITGLADGTYTFHVRQVDAAGNAGTQANRTWTVDTTPPASPSVTGPNSPSGQTSTLINFSDTEPGVTFTCSVDGGAYAPCTDPLSLTGLSDGSHTVSVRAYDAAGNGSAAGVFNWTVDHTLYTADISGAPSGVVNTTSASLTLSASLSGSTFTCSLDGAPFTACSTPVNLSGLAEGDHTFKLQASKGAQDAPEVTRSWTIDLTNPSVTITAPLAASTTGPDASVAFTATDLHVPITTTCKLDSNPASPCTSPQSYTNLIEGNHTVVVTATDAAGNSGSASVTWHADHTAPNAPQITQPASNGSTNVTTPTISGTAEANSTVKFYDGATLLATFTAAGDGTWSWTPSSPLPEATYNFHTTATDGFGNLSPSSATRVLTVDTTSPSQPVLTDPTAGLTNDGTPLVKGTAEPGSKVTVYVDGNAISGTVTVDGSGNWQKLVSPALSDGPHMITAVATDDAGNDSPPSGDLSVSVDTAAPTVSITAPASGAKINTDSPSVTFTAESGATTRCKLDGGPFASCSSPDALNGLSEGSHTVTVEATDAAGNVATTVVTFTVDLTNPTAQITGGPTSGGDDNDPTPTFSFTSNEPGTFECSIDGGPFTLCSSPFTLPALGDGPHTFAVHAVDQAGNDSPDVTRSWTVDTTAPGAPSIDTPADNTVTSDSTPTVTGDAGSAEANATLSVYIGGTLSGTTTVASDGSWSYTVPSSLSDNAYIFTAKATDSAGNVSAVSNSVHVRVDAHNPVAQITAKPSSLTNDSTPTFSFTADEPATFECKIDSGAYAACTSPFTSAALADGPHQFFVRAIDASGNRSTAEEWDWTSDVTAPVVTVTPNTPAAGLSPTFSFSSNESGTTYKCRIDGNGVFATCSSPLNAPTLSVGSHTLEVQFTDPAGNSGTKTVNFTVTAPPATQPVTQPPTTTPPVVTPPTAQTCTGSGDEPGVAANMTVINAVAKKNVIKFTTSSDKYILIRVSIYFGNKLVGTAVRANNPGKRIVAIKTKKALPKNKKFTIRLSAITMSGGKSVVGTNMVTDKTGKTTLVGADGKVGAPAVSTVDCAPEKGGKKIKVNVAAVVKVAINSKKLKVTASASDWTIATVRIVQGGKTIGRKVYLLKPKKKLRAIVSLLPGKQLVKGKAVFQVATCTVDGVWQLFKKPFKVN